MFVCLFVGIKPKKLYFTSCVRREVNPLGVITHGQRHKPPSYQRQRCKPSTCQSMVSTLQVNRLARITRLTGSHSDSSSALRTASPHALYDVLVLDRGKGKTMSDLVDGDCKLPVNLEILNKAKLHTEVLTHHDHMCSKTALKYSPQDQGYVIQTLRLRTQTKEDCRPRLKHDSGSCVSYPCCCINYLWVWTLKKSRVRARGRGQQTQHLHARTRFGGIF